MRCPTLDDLPAPPPHVAGWPWTERTIAAPARRSTGGSWPRVTLVTPSLNQSEFLEETLRSVLLQGYPNLEYFVVDGGSNDGSLEILRRYSPWLAGWSSQPDFGQAAALNRGFRAGSGEVFGFLNSDDLFLPGALAAVVDRWDRSRGQAALAGAPVEDFRGLTRLAMHPNDRFGRIDEWLDGGVSLHQPGVLWNARAWSECGPFREDLRFVFDRHFFAHCRIRGARFMHVDRPLARFRLHPRSKTQVSHLDVDDFAAEWNVVRPDLERRLSPGQRLLLRYRRELRGNWAVVRSAARSNSPAPSRELLLHLSRNPLRILHRPLAAALFRACWARAGGGRQRAHTSDTNR